MVQEQLLEYIYQGFLIPVMGPALHQNTLEEIVAATAYLDLFLRTVTEPQLLLVFFRFLLTESYDEHKILATLISRIGGHSRVGIIPDVYAAGDQLIGNPAPFDGHHQE